MSNLVLIFRLELLFQSWLRKGIMQSDEIANFVRNWWGIHIWLHSSVLFFFNLCHPPPTNQSAGQYNTLLLSTDSNKTVITIYIDICNFIKMISPPQICLLIYIVSDFFYVPILFELSGCLTSMWSQCAGPLKAWWKEKPWWCLIHVCRHCWFDWHNCRVLHQEDIIIYPWFIFLPYFFPSITLLCQAIKKVAKETKLTEEKGGGGVLIVFGLWLALEILST